MSSQVNAPGGLFIHDNHIYFADRNNHRIRKILPTGQITTIAGTDQSGFNGDNQPATSAQLNCPIDVLVSKDGSIYICDCWNHRIRKIENNGKITTIAGTGEKGFGGDGQLAIHAMLHRPQGICLSDDGDELFIADWGNNRLRMVKDGLMTTVVEIERIRGVCLSGNHVIVTESNTNRVLKIDKTTRKMEVIAGNGEREYNGDDIQAINASLHPTFVKCMNDEVYITDYKNNRIRKVLENGNIVTIVGTGRVEYNGDNQSATRANINNPCGLFITESKQIYITELNGHRIRKINSLGIISTIAGNGQPGMSQDVDYVHEEMKPTVHTEFIQENRLNQIMKLQASVVSMRVEYSNRLSVLEKCIRQFNTVNPVGIMKKRLESFVWNEANYSLDDENSMKQFYDKCDKLDEMIQWMEKEQIMPKIITDLEECKSGTKQLESIFFSTFNVPLSQQIVQQEPLEQGSSVEMENWFENWKGNNIPSQYQTESQNITQSVSQVFSKISENLVNGTPYSISDINPLLERLRSTLENEQAALQSFNGIPKEFKWFLLSKYKELEKSEKEYNEAKQNSLKLLSLHDELTNSLEDVKNGKALREEFVKLTDAHEDISYEVDVLELKVKHLQSKSRLTPTKEQKVQSHIQSIGDKKKEYLQVVSKLNEVKMKLGKLEKLGFKDILEDEVVVESEEESELINKLDI